VDLTKGDVTTTALMSKQAAAATARRMRAPDEARLKRIQTKYELPSCGGKQTKHELPSCGGKQTKYGLPSRETGGRRETAARAISHPNETPTSRFATFASLYSTSSPPRSLSLSLTSFVRLHPQVFEDPHAGEGRREPLRGEAQAPGACAPPGAGGGRLERAQRGQQPGGGGGGGQGVLTVLSV
jgi:hypothetical protein